MAKHTALLLGCGTIGAEVARLLVADAVFSGVLIADDVIRYGFTATEPIRVGSTHITPADFTAAFLSSPAADHVFQGEQTPSHIARQVQATGTQEAAPVR